MADEILVVFLTAALSAPIETRYRMCRETDGDDWGWKPHLYSQLPYTYTLTHAHTVTSCKKKIEKTDSTLVSTCLHFALAHILRIAWNMHITNKLCKVWEHIHCVHTRSLTCTLAKVLSVLQLGTQLQWCHRLLPLCWLWLLLKAEHFDSDSRVVIVQQGCTWNSSTRTHIELIPSTYSECACTLKVVQVQIVVATWLPRHFSKVDKRDEMVRRLGGEECRKVQTKR